MKAVPDREAGLEGLIRSIKDVATRYYRITGKPLGVTGEVAELAASQLLDLRLCDARQIGFDAWDSDGNRVQIKGRAVACGDRYRGRCPSFKCGGSFDYGILVLLDKQSLEPMEIWRSEEPEIEAFLSRPGSKSRNERGSMAISQFRSIGQVIWRQAG